MYYQINFSPAPPKLFGLNSSALIKTAFTQLHTVAYLGVQRAPLQEHKSASD